MTPPSEEALSLQPLAGVSGGALLCLLGSAVGKYWKHGRWLGYQIRLDLALNVSAQERRSSEWCD